MSQTRNLFSTVLVLNCLAFGLGTPASSWGRDPVFRAGAATSNITPAIGSEIIGGFVPFPSKHIHDELLDELIEMTAELKAP